MARKYELKRRALRQEETRRRIAEAALELHAALGPARTTVSAIAERAGVQRHTYYRHFPDDLSLQMACSGLHVDRDPPPDPTAWSAIRSPEERLRTGLAELYGYFERNEALIAHIIRDAELDPVTAEMSALRFGPWAAEVRDVLAADLRPNERTRVALELALEFATWRRLKRSGLSRDQAVETMVAAILCQ
jgi:AcrR family transcriptional regulator